MSLRPGLMGPAAPTDTMPDDFKDSMAALIETAFDTLRRAERMPGLALDTNTPDARDRRMLFVAIAQAVCCYLADHGSDLTVTPPLAQAESINIDILPADRLLP